MKRLARTIESIIKPVTGKPDNRRVPATRERTLTPSLPFSLQV